MSLLTYPIICLSKGRADPKLAKTLVQFSEAPPEVRKAFSVLVEPSELETYKKVFPELYFLVLPCDNPGLPMARQFAYEFFKAKKIPFWMLDDDISRFGTVSGSKVNVKPAGEVFAGANDLIDSARKVAATGNRILGQAAMEYQQFAWSALKALKWRGYCDVAVWINAEQMQDAVAYQADMVLKEDRDFTLQVLSKGFETARLCRTAFTCPTNGSNAGGLKDLYSTQGREALAVDRMVAKWPEVVSKQLKKSGRIDAKIDWKSAYGIRV